MICSCRASKLHEINIHFPYTNLPFQIEFGPLWNSRSSPFWNTVWGDLIFELSHFFSAKYSHYYSLWRFALPWMLVPATSLLRVNDWQYLSVLLLGKSIYLSRSLNTSSWSRIEVWQIYASLLKASLSRLSDEQNQLGQPSLCLLNAGVIIEIDPVWSNLRLASMCWETIHYG